MLRALMILAVLAPGVAGCATTRGGAAARGSVAIEAAPEAPSWTTIVTPADRARIAALPDLWTRARAAVPRRFARRLSGEGALLDPASALDLPTLPPGPYRCRLVRLGGPAGYASFAPDFCYVEGDSSSLSFTKQTGQTLPGGWLHADTDRRQVFLGTLRTRAASVASAYGKDPARDVAGVVERVAPFRWRLVLTKAGKGALLDIYELVPVPPALSGPQG